MSIPEQAAVSDRPYLQWGPVLAGAAGASAIWWTLMAFGSAVGLSMTSAWPGERASGATMAIVATIWTLFVHVTAYGAGGYIAGRMRAPTTDYPSDERTFRDGAHGFVVWAVAVLASGYILATVIGGVGAAATQTLSSVAGGAAAGASSQPSAGSAAASAMNVTPGQSGADMLLRPQSATPPAAGQAADATRPTPAPGAPGQTRTFTEVRDDAARVFASSLRTGTLSPGDRQYLAAVTAERTGMPQPQAEARVDQAFAAAQNAERQARDAADKARKGSAIAAFLTAAALLVSLAAAVAAAGLGGRHRDEGRAQYAFGMQRIW